MSSLWVEFDIGNAGPLKTSVFERTVRNIEDMHLERLNTSNTEIKYKATTGMPKSLVILGAAIYIHNEQIGYYPTEEPHQQTEAARTAVG